MRSSRAAHRGVEVGNEQHFLEQFAVHIRKRGELFVEIGRTFGGGSVEHLKKLGELRAEIGAVGRGALLKPSAEASGGLEDAGVFGEQREQQAHQQHFERMAGESARFELVVQPPHALGGFDVDRVLRLDDLGLITRYEGEMLDALVEVGEQEFCFGVFFQIVEAEAREIRDQDIARQVALDDAVEILRCLRERAVQVLTTAFVLDEQFAFPERVDTAVFELFSGARHLHLLLEDRDTLAFDAEDGEKLIPKTLRLGALGGFAFPAAREFQSTVADFVPGKGHAVGRSLWMPADDSEELGSALSLAGTPTQAELQTQDNTWIKRAYGAVTLWVGVKLIWS